MIDALPRTVRDLLALRKKYGANSAIGHRCSNIIQMLKQPQINAKGIQYQRDGIAAALAELTEDR